jgi:hypothetical protein
MMQPVWFAGPTIVRYRSSRHCWQFWLWVASNPRTGCQSEDNWCVGQRTISINSLVIWLAKDRILSPIKIKTRLHRTVFSLLFFFCVGRWDQSILPIIIDYLHDKPSAVPDVIESEIFVCSTCYSNRTYTWPPERQLIDCWIDVSTIVWENNKMWHFKFLDFPTFQTMTMLLTMTTWTKTVETKTLSTSWMANTQNVTPFSRGGYFKKLWIQGSHMFRNRTL